MDKKACRTFSVHSFSERDKAMVVENEYIRYLFSVEMMGNIIVLSVGEREKILEGCLKPSYRMFIDYEGMDYITQDLRQDKTKWLTAPLMSTLELYSWSGAKSYLNTDFDLFENKMMFSNYFKGNAMDEILRSLRDWQDSVVDKRRHDREWKELEPVRELMKTVPALPEGFEEFVNVEPFWNNKYLIYDASTSKRMRPAFCTSCKEHFELDTKKFVPHRWEMQKCPKCGQTVVLQSIGLWHEKERCSSRWSVIQNAGDMILIRSGNCYKYLVTEKNEHEVVNFSESVEWFEDRRTFFSKDGQELYDCEHGQYKTYPSNQWMPDESNYWEDVLMTDGVEDVLSGTAFKYLGITNLQKAWRGRKIPSTKLMRNFKKHPEIEYLTKCGFLKCTKEYVGSGYGWVNYSGNISQIYKLQKLPKMLRKAVKDADAGFNSVEFLNANKGIKEPYETMKTWLRAFPNNQKVWDKVHEHRINTLRFARYALKQKQSFGVDWLDYVGWCERLEYDLHDNYYSMPPKFTRAHDNALEAIKAIENAELMEKIKVASARFTGLLESAEGLMDKDLGLLIRLPVDAEEIKQEGEVLHHCVATYIKRVAAGETQILFIRKKEAPNSPYYTLEYRNGKVVQCRGLRNCDPTPKVKKFVDMFKYAMEGINGKTENLLTA